MQKKEYDVLKIYSKLHIYATLIIGILEIASYTSLGETKGLILHLDKFELTFFLILQILTLGLPYLILKKTCSKRLGFCKGSYFRLEINHGFMHIFMLILLILNIYFTAATGNATLGKNVTSKFSFIFNIIQITPLFMIYYVCARQIKKRIYWINIILFSSFRFMCGWSSHILLIAFLEFFLRIKHSKPGFWARVVMKFNTILVFIAFIAGSLIYCYVFPFKNSIRYGYNMGFTHLSFSEGISELLSRLTNYPVTIAAVQNHIEIVDLYQKQNNILWEVKSIFSPLLPRFIMPNKEFRTLSNIVKLTIYPEMDRGTGSGYNTFVYWMNILECDLSCFLIAIVVFILFFVISKKLIYLFDDGSRDVDILYFIFLFSIFNDSNLSTIFGYGFIPLIYPIPIMIMLGIVKIRKYNDFKSYNNYVYKIGEN